MGYPMVIGLNMSATVPPPTARTGEQKNPVRKRQTRMVSMLWTRVIGSWKMMNATAV
jgi:hypothetical protein